MSEENKLLQPISSFFGRFWKSTNQIILGGGKDGSSPKVTITSIAPASTDKVLTIPQMTQDESVAFLSSPAFTGTPTAPTQSSGDNSTKIATTAYADAVQTAVNASNFLGNLGLSTSVSSNALTIALKDSAGSNPSAGSPVKIGFRSATITAGTYNIRSVTGATSLVISSGSTLGCASGQAHDLYVYALDNAGTVELAVSMTAFENGSLQSTTAEGGSGAADVNNVIYSATARTSVPVRLIGKINITEATAGTWASNATSLAIAPFNIRPIYALYTSSAGQTINAGATAIVDYGTKNTDTHNAVVTGSSWAFTAPKAAQYTVTPIVRYGNGLNWTLGSYQSMFIYVNGSSVVFRENVMQVVSTALAQGPSADKPFVVNLAKGDTLDFRTSHGEATSRALVASDALVNISIVENINISV